MASKSKAGSSGPRATKSTTPGPSTAAGHTSPTRYSRQHEKEELSNLNDRLACYIDKVRSLETENSRLTREVRTKEEIISREVNSVKSMYDKELGDARKLLDELSTEKARIELDVKRIYDLNSELQRNLDSKSSDVARLSADLSLAERQLADFTAKYNQANSERKRLQDENKKLLKENQKLEDKNKELEARIQEETLQRIEAETNLVTAKEQLEFKEQMHQQQLLEVRTRKEVEISELDGRKQQEYEQTLLASLQEVREQCEIDNEAKNEELKRLYEEKIRSLESQLSRNSQAASMALDEMKQLTVKLEESNRKLRQVEQERDAMNQRSRDLERDLELAKNRLVSEFAKQDQEVTRLRQEMAAHQQEYQDLMDVKIKLDVEIANYRKLLEEEESRLNITPVLSPAARQTPRRAKRKRMVGYESEESAVDWSVSSTASGDIQIYEEDKEGKYIKVLNKGGATVALQGWQLIRKVGDLTTVYKFTRAAKLEPGASLTVWSSDAPGKISEPPSDFVMRAQSWPTGDVLATSLLNAAGDEVAASETKKVQRSTSSSWGTTGLYTSEFGREAAGAQGEKCAIM